MYNLRSGKKANELKPSDEGVSQTQLVHDHVGNFLGPAGNTPRLHLGRHAVTSKQPPAKIIKKEEPEGEKEQHPPVGGARSKPPAKVVKKEEPEEEEYEEFANGGGGNVSPPSPKKPRSTVASVAPAAAGEGKLSKKALRRMKRAEKENIETEAIRYTVRQLREPSTFEEVAQKYHELYGEEMKEERGDRILTRAAAIREHCSKMPHGSGMKVLRSEDGDSETKLALAHWREPVTKKRPPRRLEELVECLMEILEELGNQASFHQITLAYRKTYYGNINHETRLRMTGSGSIQQICRKIAALSGGKIVHETKGGGRKDNFFSLATASGPLNDGDAEMGMDEDSGGGYGSLGDYSTLTEVKTEIEDVEEKPCVVQEEGMVVTMNGGKKRKWTAAADETVDDNASAFDRFDAGDKKPDRSEIEVKTEVEDVEEKPCVVPKEGGPVAACFSLVFVITCQMVVSVLLYC